MKLYFLVKLLVLHYACARVPVKQLKEIENIRISDNGKNFLINLEGPLNPLKGEFLLESGYMYNIRFFSPYINTSYSLKFSYKDSREEEEVHTYTRNPQKDIAYEPEYNETGYMPEYYNAILGMFSFDNNQRLSLETLRPYAFTNFLMGEDLKGQDKYRILAALLLLSEGADVSLKWEGEESTPEKLVLRKKSAKKSTFFSIKVQHKVAPRKDYNEYAKTDVKAVIDFFIHNKKSTEEPLTMKEFRKGDFLNTPQFLVQTYIFEFINTIEDAKELSTAVYEILNDILLGEKEEEQNPAENTKRVSATAVFERCFVSENSSTQISYLNAFKEVNSTLQNFSFSYFVIKQISPSESDSDLEYDLSFADDVQELIENKKYSFFLKDLLKLFSFLLLDLNTGEYSTEHIEDPSSPLINFFKMYTRINQDISSVLFEEWYRMFDNLQKKQNRSAESPLNREYMNIVYKDSGNEPHVGIFDFLLIISEVTGMSTIRTETLEFIEELKGQETLTDEFCRRVKYHLESTLKSFATNQNIEIVYLNFKKDINIEQNGKQDIFADIIMNIDSKDTNYTGIYNVYLLMNNTELANKLVSLSEIHSHDDLFEILPSTVKEKDSFMRCLLTDYINRNILRISKERERANLNDAIKKIVGEKEVNINALLIQRNMYDIEVKQYFLVYAIVHAKEEDKFFNSQSLIVRFISNIVGSISLDNGFIRHYFLRMLIYTGMYSGILRGHIEMNSDKYIKEIVNNTNINIQCLRVLEHIAQTNCPDALINALQISTDLVKERGGPMLAIPVHNSDVLCLIFDYVFKDGEIEVATQILSNYKETIENIGGKVVDVIKIYWFVLACEKNRDHELIRKLYDLLNMDSILEEETDENKETELYSVTRKFREAFEAIENKTNITKELLSLKESDDDSKFKDVKACLQHFSLLEIPDDSSDEEHDMEEYEIADSSSDEEHIMEEDEIPDDSSDEEHDMAYYSGQTGF